MHAQTNSIWVFAIFEVAKSYLSPENTGCKNCFFNIFFKKCIRQNYLGFKCNFTVNTISAKLCQLDCVISPILKRCYHILLPGLLPALSHSGRDPNLFQQSFLGFKQLNLHFHFVKVDIKLVS